MTQLVDLDKDTSSIVTSFLSYLELVQFSQTSHKNKNNCKNRLESLYKKEIYDFLDKNVYYNRLLVLRIYTDFYGNPQHNIKILYIIKYNLKELFRFIRLNDIKHVLLELHGPLIIKSILTEIDFMKFIIELRNNHTIETFYTNVYIETYRKEQKEYKKFLQEIVNDHPSLQYLSMLKSGSSKMPENLKYEIQKSKF